MVERFLKDVYLKDASIVFESEFFAIEETVKVMAGEFANNKIILGSDNGNIEINVKNCVITHEMGELGEDVYVFSTAHGTATFQFKK